MTEYMMTFALARANGACSDGVDRMREHLGADWPDDKPFPLTTVLEVSGLDDALWGLDVVDQAACRLVASDFAAHVAHLNTDPRVWAAIKAARGYAHGRIDDVAMTAAEAAARTAARDVARAAARASARASASARAAAWDVAWAAAEAAARASARASARAARAAEHAWQTRHLHAVLTGTRKPGNVRQRKAG